MWRFVAITLASITTLSSCATLTRNRCEDVDWQSRGLFDANSGVNRHDFIDYCTSKGFVANLTDYNKGYEEGLSNYCRSELATRIGNMGQKFNSDICPTDVRLQLERDNLAALVEHLGEKSQDKVRRNNELEEAFSKLELQVKLAKMNPATRVDILKNIDQLRHLLDLDKPRAFGARF